MKNLAFALLVGFVGLNTPASAAEVWWHQVPANAAQDNGNVTLLDANGNPVNMVVNPTAAAVKANRAAATQPPTVVVQATTGYWKDPVAAVANLPPAGNATGDVRMVMSTAKPYMWNGSKWVEQSSDYSGTIAAGNVLIKNVATEGSSCSPNGLVAATTTGLLLSCQSGVWRKVSLSVTGKDSQAGPVSSVLRDYGHNPGDGLHYFCKDYQEVLEATGVVLFNIQTAGTAEQSRLSQLAALVAIDGRVLASNYDIAQSDNGGFSVSSSASDTLAAGSHLLRICAAARAVSDWTASYSVSVIR
ncbi:shufflon system plasmid conjugative transfer pilus tip adhesin PilV [Achromobacter xylosoxidans]|uniref:shufflon system plasmid conjugative transfer pilus tip adhesin PilV n=1 Tax=Alcaligenes xylosoxydans xylosoxydans TaxID=85698 RepID=UPI0006C346B7|nr:shufflon system plasmid conjugative transfer pilus tip adhesin PilV [Achromobacter xylosoxidans]CUJ63478.1 Uncharacterised protein [Achromobacter xylosoxidans]